MKIQDIIKGKPFMYKGTEYVMQTFLDDSKCITRFGGMYVANVEYIGRRIIKVFTFVMDKRVSVSINVNECEEVK
jgi:hypothetical protein